jgi:hypothetical protein
LRKDEIYNEIGQIIVDSISDEWEVSTLNIIRLDKYVSVDGFYIDKYSNKHELDNSNLGYFFSLKIHELYEIMAKEIKNPWNKLKFILYQAGKFEIDFIWDQEYQDEIDILNKS